jgi:hypothetical protein
MNIIKQLIQKWIVIDQPPVTDTFKKNNPAYLQWIDSNLGRDDIDPIDDLNIILDEFVEGPKQLIKIGWGLIIPIVSLIGFVILIGMALTGHL